jgi:hypothetical protein
MSSHVGARCISPARTDTSRESFRRWRDGYIRPLHGEDDKTLAHSISLARVDIFREFVDI